MKHLKLFTLMAAAIVFVACAREASQNNPQPNPQPQPQPVLCGANQAASPIGCTTINAPPVVTTGPILFFGDNYRDNYASPYSNGELNSDATGFTRFIKKAMQICDRASTTCGINSCEKWSSAYMSLKVSAASPTSNQVQIEFAAKYRENTIFNCELGFFPATFGLPSNPLFLTGVVQPMNDGKGFEIRTFGSSQTEAYKSLIVIKVAEGKLDNTYLNAEVTFEGQRILTGTLRKM